MAELCTVKRTLQLECKDGVTTHELCALYMDQDSLFAQAVYRSVFKGIATRKRRVFCSRPRDTCTTRFTFRASTAQGSCWIASALRLQEQVV